MGYRTVREIPYIRNFAEAKTVFLNAKPIRGKDIRPLGARRDYNSYSIRAVTRDNLKLGECATIADITAIQCVLYKTPVVTFHADDTLTLVIDGWSSVSTAQFISEVLPGVSAWRQRGELVYNLPGHGDFVLPKQGLTKLVRDDQGRWCPENKGQGQFVHRVNRTRSAAVRARYKEFTTYVASQFKLRAKDRTGYGKTYKVLAALRAEYAEMFGGPVQGPVNTQFIPVPVGAPAVAQKRNRTLTEYRASADKFFNLIRSDQPEDEKHANFYRGLLLLVMFANGGNAVYVQNLQSWDRPVWSGQEQDLSKTFTELLYRRYSEEVFDRVQLEPGIVRDNPYRDWQDSACKPEQA